MNTALENDLKRCAVMLESLNWCIQNNHDDKKTNFIYETDSLDECIRKIKQEHLEDKQGYVLHRWYNFHTSVYCEEIFCDYGAVHEKDKKNHDVDIYINGISFDVKLTVYPKELRNERPYNLKTRSGKNSMIEWMYYNQSQGKRKQLINRLYVVCDADDSKELLKMKSDFDLLRKPIENFMKSDCAKNFNRILLVDEKDNKKEYMPYSDLIYVHK